MHVATRVRVKEKVPQLQGSNRRPTIERESLLFTVNASDNRGKADSTIAEGIGGSTTNSIKELISNEALSSNMDKSKHPKSVLIMDEVDGLLLKGVTEAVEEEAKAAGMYVHAFPLSFLAQIPSSNLSCLENITNATYFVYRPSTDSINTPISCAFSHIIILNL
ncbi:uncharacterized protein LOC131238042 [Magnolia sinica]|uniref:uncharacterized protein LOC131238042 n=1 Tax=Magnolia sinica TaxID=86752 RepID=UPI002659D455|nr:uncharacterized protein LOC131238042 [Magnolia sinica]